jgi:hypothetical protein
MTIKSLIVLVMIALISLVLVGGVGWAAQNLVWDDPNPPEAGVYEYQAEFVNDNGQMVANPIVPKGTWIEVTVPAGTYIVTVKAHNIWAWSDPSEPFTFTKNKPLAPVNLRFE